MASNTQDEILKAFENIAGKRTSSANGEIGDTREGYRAQISDGASESAPTDTVSGDGQGDVAATPTGQNVQGGSKTEAQGSSSSAQSVITDVFESGFGVVPLVGELLGLFSGGSSSPAPLLKYQMPPSISFTSAETADGLSAAGYDQMGLPRMYDTADGDASSNGGVTAGAAPVAGAGNSAGTGAAAPQVTVSVQAMDAQSFLDRSSDIAQAVRSAMLSMSLINDVVNEL